MDVVYPIRLAGARLVGHMGNKTEDTLARIRELYGLPLDRFTTERNDLARALKDEGRAEEAGTVKKLTKPSVAAWAVDQLARTQAQEMEQLLSLRDRLRGAPSPDEIRSISAERHQLISDLTEKARAILEGSGNSASGQTLGKVSGTLYGGATEEERDALRHGTLTRELQATGFEDVSELDWSLGPDASSSGPAPSKRAERALREKDELEAELQEAERAAETLEREARQAARAEEVAANDAQNARARVERLRARLEKL
jgi:hypothetical protein